MVDTAADEDLQNDSCSLREAIVAANTNASYNGCAASGAGMNDMIVFNLDPPKIDILGTPLPPITEWITIDGGAGRVELHGPGGPRVSGQHGLTVNHDGFGMVRGIYIGPPASNAIIRGNFVGTDVTGTLAVGNQLGIETYPATVTIGGTTPEARNVVSGNTSKGIQVRGVSPTVQGNYFGTTSDGTTAVPGTFTDILVYQADGATIGGTMPGAGNLISGASVGVTIEESVNTQIVGNLFGTAADGSTPLPNGTRIPCPRRCCSTLGRG